jgi:hypothetical protein
LWGYPTQPRENNNIFNQLGETGGMLKLTVFPKKSAQFQIPVCLVGGRG